MALKGLGSSVQFLTREVSSKVADDEIPTTYYPLPHKTWPGRFRKIFVETVGRFQPHIIHVHQPLPAFLLIPWQFAKPIVYNFYSPWPEEFRIKSSRWPSSVRRMLSPLLTTIERGTAKRASAIAVLSEFSRLQLRQLYGRESVLIPGGVDGRRFRPPATSRSQETLRLITVRNLVPRMGLSRLIRAMTLLPPQTELHIGGEGPLRSQLDQLIMSLGLNERVRLIGHVPEEELPAFYSSADWFVLPTVALEGFGLVILESLACGTPVLGTRIGAIPELLERFDPDWVIEEPTPEAIAATVTVATRNAAPSRTELHERVAREFDWTSIGQRYLTLFENLL